MTYNSSFTGAQVDGAVTDVQAAKAASATDTTAGRLLKVGDFGVGQSNEAPPINDATIGATAGGFYRNTSSASTFATAYNIPYISSVLLVSYNNVRAGGVAIGIDGGSVRANIFSDQNGTRLSERIFHTGNLLGTVSESGGVPTGAVIESGNTTPVGAIAGSGRYTRFADGTLICSFRAITDSANAIQTFTWPSNFAVSPSVSVSFARNVDGDYANVAIRTISGISVEIQGSAFGSSSSINVIAHGRWF